MSIRKSPAVGYLRVSTREQGRSGLGLAAQRFEIEAFGAREGLTVKSWHQDVQTGAGADALQMRPGLAAAPVAYVQQANIGNAVQVNNNAGVTDGVENPPNEVLEQQPNEWLERRTPSKSGGADQELEAVGAIHRTKDGDR